MEIIIGQRTWAFGLIQAWAGPAYKNGLWAGPIKSEGTAGLDFLCSFQWHASGLFTTSSWLGDGDSSFYDNRCDQAVSRIQVYKQKKAESEKGNFDKVPKKPHVSPVRSGRGKGSGYIKKRQKTKRKMTKTERNAKRLCKIKAKSKNDKVRVQY
ncbi:hypothetical protein Tco_1532802 [Tanacetum coccineum]